MGEAGKASCDNAATWPQLKKIGKLQVYVRFYACHLALGSQNTNQRLDIGTQPAEALAAQAAGSSQREEGFKARPCHVRGLFAGTFCESHRCVLRHGLHPFNATSH